MFVLVEYGFEFKLLFFLIELYEFVFDDFLLDLLVFDFFIMIFVVDIDFFWLMDSIGFVEEGCVDKFL